MKSDDADAIDEARWQVLLGAEACDELLDGERAELERLERGHPGRLRERQVLSALPKLVPLATDLNEADEQLIDDLLEPRKGRRSKLSPGLLAAVVLIPLAAAAASLGWFGSSKTPVVAPHPTPGTMDKPTEEQKPPPELPPTAEQPEPEAEPAPTAVAPATPSLPAPSAADLLSKAQNERARRDYGSAIHTYQQLLRLHPASGEAQLGRLSLAQLQLTQGNASSALSGFRAYRRSGGALAQEAHYGEIQALEALGQKEEERAEIQRFLTRYPNSVQGPALKRRLGDDGARQ